MIRLTPFQLAGLLAAMLACFTFPVTVAYNIGAIVSGYGASASQAGLVATAQGLGTAVGALLASHFIARFTTRSMLFAGLGLLATGNALSSQAASIELLTLFQVIGGFGTGLVVSIVFSTAARTVNPELTYGFINASFGAYIIFLGFVIPSVIIAGGISGAFLLYALIAVAGLGAAFAVPNVDTSGGHAHRGPAPADSAFRSKVNVIGLVALTGLGVFFFAQAGLAAFVERIGVASGISLVMVGQVFAVGGLLTIVGPLAAGWIGARFGATPPLIFVAVSLFLVTFALTILRSPESFYLSAPLFTVLPAILMPSFLGALAKLDPSGRSAGMQPAFATLGGAFGPFASGIVVQEGGFDGLGYYTMAVFGLSVALMAAATLGADRKQPWRGAPLTEDGTRA